jgi:hypothetical protein
MPHDATVEEEHRVFQVFPEINAIGRCPPRAAK